jgi:hypothetical protein
MAKIPFMDVRGADPSAVMKGDIPQHVDGSTAPNTKPKRPRPVASPFRLPPKKKGKRK